jgi:hypothetical protein
VKFEGADSGATSSIDAATTTVDAATTTVDAATTNGIPDVGAPDEMTMVPGSGQVCVPGVPKACACRGGAQGTQACNAGGTGYLGCGGCPQNGSNGLCTVPDVARARVTGDTLADFEGAAPDAIKSVTPGGGNWYSYQDDETGTLFKPDPNAWSVESPGHGGSGSAVHVAGSGFIGPPSATNWGGGSGFALAGFTAGGLAVEGGMTRMATDLSAYNGISFYAKSSLASDISVDFATADTSPSYCTCDATGICYAVHSILLRAVPADWTKYTVKFSDLMQPEYVFSPIPLDRTSVLDIDFASNGPVATFDFWIDDVTLIH